MEQWFEESLRCPVTGARLQRATNDDGTTELVAEEGASPRLAFPVIDDVPHLLEAYARSID